MVLCNAGRPRGGPKGCRYNGAIIASALLSMPVKAPCRARSGLVLLVGASVAVLAGCGSFNGAGNRIASVITPYKIDVVQGNFVSREQVEALQPGMSRQQVREILGTPLVTSLFHADRWEYVFTIKRPGEEPQTRKLTVFFKGDALERSEGDTTPTEIIWPNPEFDNNITVYGPEVRSLAASGVREVTLLRGAAPEAKEALGQRVARTFAELVVSDGDAPGGAGRLAVENLLEVADPTVSSAARRALATLADVRGEARGTGGGADDREIRRFSTRAYEAITTPELDADGDIEVVGDD